MHYGIKKLGIIPALSQVSPPKTVNSSSNSNGEASGDGGDIFGISNNSSSNIGQCQLSFRIMQYDHPQSIT